VHAAEAVHVVGDTARLLNVGEVAADYRSAALDEVADGGEPVAVASVDDDFVPAVEQRLRGQPSETVCGAGDEDPCHQSPPPSRASTSFIVVVRASAATIGST
ncbi:MAG TPA: hypothetical protein VGJ58_03515, partial [Gaiellaceae bacterium]